MIRTLPVLIALAACTVVPDPNAPGPGEPGALPPPGFGTLRQDDVSISLSSDGLQIKVTPLAESVIRVTAPDTERRLRGLVVEHTVLRRGGSGHKRRILSVWNASQRRDGHVWR